MDTVDDASICSPLSGRQLAAVAVAERIVARSVRSIRVVKTEIS